MKKPIILQGVMEIEIEVLTNLISNIEKIELNSCTFYKGYINNYPVIISLTDIGVINSTIATTIAILQFNPKYIMNIGVAGGHDSKIHRNDIVIGNRCVNINTIETKNRKENEGIDANEWDIREFTSDDLSIKTNSNLVSDEQLINYAKKEFHNYSKGNIFEGTLGSGDIWNKEVDRINIINKQFGTLCEDMESIGTYSVCSKFNIPVIGIRAISNNELHNEEYDRSVSCDLQKHIYNMCTNIIKDLGE